MSDTTTRPRLLNRIGPAFVVGACIIGPGSVTLMSNAGAMYGYRTIWLALLSGAFMAGFIALFMRFGILSDETFLGVVRRRAGASFAVICGIALSSVNTSFQFGNNLGVTAAMDALLPGLNELIWPIFFTALAVIFLFAFKNLYRVIEKVMTVFLVGMFLAFLFNLLRARPDVSEALAGAFVPRLPENPNWVALGGLVATTFVIVAAFFQSYLVHAKGWKERDLATGAADTILAAIFYTLIGVVIMMTAAVLLFPRPSGVDFPSMVSALEGIFGPYAKLVFCIGFWAAAFSSFITNSLVGAVLLNDGLGLGGRLNATATRVLATLIMLIGMGTALAIIHVGRQPATIPSAESTIAQAHSDSPRTATTRAAAAAQPASHGQDARATTTRPRDLKVKAIAIGQAATLLAAPFAAITMVLVLFDRRAVKGRTLGLFARCFVLLGAAALLGVAILMYANLSDDIASLLGRT
jgi:Mn2+/Fe2+ NRAMP family transporter